MHTWIIQVVTERIVLVEHVRSCPLKSGLEGEAATTTPNRSNLHIQITSINILNPLDANRRPHATELEL